LFVLPPRSPRLNGHVERTGRTHKEEFYYRLAGATSLARVNKLPAALGGRVQHL